MQSLRAFSNVGTPGRHVKVFELDVTQWARVIFGCCVLEIYELQLSVIIICVILQDTLRDEPFPTMFMLTLKYQIRILQFSLKSIPVAFVHILMCH